MSDSSNSTKLIIEKLDELILRVGGYGEKSWPYLVREAVISGWTMLVSAILGLILTIVLTGIWLHLDKDIFSDWSLPVEIAAGVTGVLTFGCLVGLIFEGIPALLNPQYRAIQDLFSLIRRDE